jgi:signal-transduction protein with cAMP-binding, CBS, and nucleotidyltransferase domain
MEDTPVEAIMSKTLVVMDCNSSIFEIANTMLQKKASSVLLVDSGKPVGILTERDLVRQVCAKDMLPSKTPATTIMSAPVTAVDKGATIRQAAEKMAKHGIRHLGVLAGRKIVGIVTATDIARHVGRQVATATIWDVISPYEEPSEEI